MNWEWKVLYVLYTFKSCAKLKFNKYAKLKIKKLHAQNVQTALQIKQDAQMKSRKSKKGHGWMSPFFIFHSF